MTVRVETRPCINRSPLGLFRRHVVHRAEHLSTVGAGLRGHRDGVEQVRVVGALGQSEVEHFRHPNR